MPRSSAWDGCRSSTPACFPASRFSSSTARPSVYSAAVPGRVHQAKVDVDRIRADNNAKQGPEIYRKNGLITNQGGKLKPEALAALREANIAKYGLSDEQVTAIVLPDPPRAKNLGADAYMGPNHNKGGIAGRRTRKRARSADVLTVDVDALSRPAKISLLTAPRADCPLWHWRQVRLRLT